MKKYIYIIFFFLVGLMTAQQERQLFGNANKLYQEGKYNEALMIYKQLESQQLESDDLYYNMGNAHYKMNQVAPAIYYYEKALMLNPHNSDAKHNLTFAKRMALDNIEALPKTIGQRFSEGFIQKLTYDTWAWLGVILAFLFAILFLLYHFTYDSSRKRFFFVTSIISAVIALVFTAFAYNNYRYVKSNRYAIIFAQQLDVKSAPTPAGEISFELHEGAKVKLLENLDNWRKIKLVDGKIGWVPAEDLRELN